MTIARCPECHDEVRVPTDASREAMVACPWCGNEFQLSRILADVPPLLIVLSDPGGKTASTGMPFMIDTGTKSETPLYDFEERAAPQAEPVSTLVMSTPSRRARPQPKGGGLITAAAVLLGGLCSIPLAQLCLWWIFGQDPVEAGPKVAQYASFLVPKRFRGTGSELPREILPKSGDSTAGDGTLGGAGGGPFNGLSERPPEDASTPSAADVSPVPRGEASSENVDPADGTRLPTSPLVPGPVGPVLPTPEDVKRPQVLSDQPVTETDRIDGALQKILINYDTWLKAGDLDDETRPVRLDGFYQGYCELGDSLAFANPVAPGADQWLGLVDQTLKIHFGEDRLLRFLANKAKQLLAAEFDEQRPGIALAGNLQSIEQPGDFWRLRVRLGDGTPKMVDVMGWLPPPTALQVGDEVIVLGRRVADPQALGWGVVDGVEPILGGYLTIVGKRDF